MVRLTLTLTLTLTTSPVTQSPGNRNPVTVTPTPTPTPTLTLTLTLTSPRFLATRAAAEKLQKFLYTAENSLEIRLRECISTRAFRRMRRILTEVKENGKWARLVLMHPVKARGKGGGSDPSLTKEMNADIGIYPNRPVYAPSPIADNKAVKAASVRLLGGRDMAVAIPSRDGMSGAAWDLQDSAKDVFAGVAKQLRKLPVGRLRRLWIGFDGLTWTARNGLVRWCLRCVDVGGKQNDPSMAREGITYTGEDKNAGLVAASKIGGDKSIRKRTDDGVVVKKISVSELPEAVRKNTSDEGKAMAEALCYECSVEIEVGPEGELQKSLCVQGGDRAAGHAAFALDSCIHKDGVCMRCLLRKKGGAWTKQEDCDAAVRRGAVLQSLLCHCDPRPRMKGYENIAPLKCPCCLEPVTPELMKKEADEYAELSENQQKKYRSQHSKTHYGAMPFEEIVIFQDPKYRGSSHLHRRTNMAHNNVLATFMSMTFDRSKRLRMNDKLEDANVMVRFPTKNKDQRMPKLGNGDDARILHSNPGLLVSLHEICYEDDPLLKDPAVIALLKELKEAAAGAAKLVGPSKRSPPKKRSPAAMAAAAKEKAKAAKKKPRKKKAPKARAPKVQAAKGGGEAAAAAADAAAKVAAEAAAKAAAEAAAAAKAAALAARRNLTANAATVEAAANKIKCNVTRYSNGAEVSAKLIKEMVELTKLNMGEFSTEEALRGTEADLKSERTRIIAVQARARGTAAGQLMAFMAYRLNCNEDGKNVGCAPQLGLGVARVRVRVRVT